MASVRFLVLCGCSLVLLAVFGSVPSLALKSSSDLVERVCRRTPDYVFCMAILNRDPGTADADRYKLAIIAFRMAYLDAKDSLAYVDRLLKDHSVRDSLEKCHRDYVDATHKFLEANNDMNADNYDALGFYATAAGKDADDCRVAFRGAASPLDNNNRDMKGYSEIGIAIATLFD